MIDNESNNMSNQILSSANEVHMANDWFDIISPTHFWIQWRLQVISKHLHDLLPSKSIGFDIGCGNGLFMRQIEERFNITVDGCDLNKPVLDVAIKGRGTIYQYNILEHFKEFTKRYDVIFLLDVLEHIDDDVSFLNAAAEHITDNGLVVINVPAIPCLTSVYDEVAGHRRRYDKETLRSLIEQAGLSPVRIVPWGFSLIPLLTARKLLFGAIKPSRDSVIRKGFSPPGKISNKMLDLLGCLERRIMPSPFIGTSILMIAKRQS